MDRQTPLAIGEPAPREGIVRYASVTDDPLVPPDIEEVLKAVEALASS